MWGPAREAVRQQSPLYASAMDHLVKRFEPALPPSIDSPAELQRLSTTHPYFARELSPTWQDYFSHIPKEKRHEETVQRRLGFTVVDARYRHTCPYCWFPVLCCECPRLIRESGPVQAALAAANVKVTFILHGDEVFRLTNTAHVAALMMNANILVWGLPEHNAQIESLGREGQRMKCSILTDREREDVSLQEERCNGNLDNNQQGDNEPFLDVLLYPEVGKSITPQEVVRQLQRLGSDIDETDRQKGTKCRRKGIHILLSDGTWPQARQVNRNVPRNVPRVALDMSALPHHDPLFHTLRKRTREEGFSTLEATALAVESFLCLLTSNKSSPAAPTPFVNEAVRVEDTEALQDGVKSPSSSTLLTALMTVMRKFVDIVALQSTKEEYTCVALSLEEREQIIASRNHYKVFIQSIEESARLHGINNFEKWAESRPAAVLSATSVVDVVKTAGPSPHDASADVRCCDDRGESSLPSLLSSESHSQTMALQVIRSLMPAPVTCYCYVCEAFIGFSRMGQHVTGSKHARRVAEGKTSEPTEVSRTHSSTESVNW